MAKLTLSFRSKTINAYFFETGQSISIGRNEDNDITIDSLAIAPVHVTLIFKQSGAMIEPENETTIVYVNEKVITSTELQHGDSITIGKHTLLYSDEKPAIEMNQSDEGDSDFADVSSKLFGRKIQLGNLQVLSGSKAGHVIQLSKSQVRIGKSNASEVEFLRCNDGYYFSATRERHTGSVRLNNEPVHKQTLKIADGDYLKIDNTELLFFEE